jgi:hypothetical protein
VFHRQQAEAFGVQLVQVLVDPGEVGLALLAGHPGRVGVEQPADGFQVRDPRRPGLA